MFQEAQTDYLIEVLQLEEIETCNGQNQEMVLGRPRETRWGFPLQKFVTCACFVPFNPESSLKDWKRVIIVRRLLELKL
jgi:hypothetical protein